MDKDPTYIKYISYIKMESMSAQSILVGKVSKTINMQLFREI